MAKIIHTHRGHCQLCTMVQAIDPTTGAIALHGYTVAHGYFLGTCPGSNHKSLHVDRSRADRSIAQARKEAQENLDLVAMFNRYEINPTKVWNGEYHKVPAPTERNANRTRDERTMIEYADATTTQQDRQRREEVDSHQRRAKMCTEYANDLEAWADKITGKVQTYQVRDLDPRDWEVGDTVRIGGKKGYDAIIEAIEERDYRVNSFRQGYGTVKAKHGRLTRPAITEKRVSEKAGGYVTREARPAHTYWQALREIKRPPSALAAALKKEGKL